MGGLEALADMKVQEALEETVTAFTLIIPQTIT